MHQTISVTDAARNFSDLINRVYYQGQAYLLTRGGQTVAQVTLPEKTLTAAELLAHWAARPHLDIEDAAQWEKELADLKASVAPPGVSPWDS